VYFEKSVDQTGNSGDALTQTRKVIAPGAMKIENSWRHRIIFRTDEISARAAQLCNRQIFAYHPISCFRVVFIVKSARRAVRQTLTHAHITLAKFCTPMWST